MRSYENLKIVIKYSFQTFHKEDACLPLLISAEYPQEQGKLPTPVFWPGEFLEQRSLEGYSSWGHRVGHT